MKLMKKFIPLLCALTLVLACQNQNPQSSNPMKNNIAAIRQVMLDQQKAWSRNDLEGFMQGYWKSDSLKFYGQSGLTKGWSLPWKTIKSILAQRIQANSVLNYSTSVHSSGRLLGDGTLSFRSRSR